MKPDTGRPLPAEAGGVGPCCSRARDATSVNLHGSHGVYVYVSAGTHPAQSRQKRPDAAGYGRLLLRSQVSRTIVVRGSQEVFALTKLNTHNFRTSSQALQPQAQSREVLGFSIDHNFPLRFKCLVIFIICRSCMLP